MQIEPDPEVIVIPQAIITLSPKGREINVKLALSPSLPKPIRVLAERLTQIALGHPATLKHLVALIREYLRVLPADERLATIAEVSAGWCSRCGDKAPCGCRGPIVAATSLKGVRQ